MAETETGRADLKSNLEEQIHNILDTTAATTAAITAAVKCACPSLILHVVSFMGSVRYTFDLVRGDGSDERSERKNARYCTQSLGCRGPQDEGWSCHLERACWRHGRSIQQDYDGDSRLAPRLLWSPLPPPPCQGSCSSSTSILTQRRSRR